ncbi:hypothetical protein [Microcystis aeruginosa]|nr:hypothetical protein [Microcystis aeruginosa]MDB9416387.1 hypothetical protein [Microcystis aeruginosa CS-556/03]
MGKTPHPTPTKNFLPQTLCKLAIELTINKITVSRRRDETLPKNSYS